MVTFHEEVSKLVRKLEEAQDGKQRKGNKNKEMWIYVLELCET